MPCEVGYAERRYCGVCGGTGEHTDYTDSGSGWMVWCGCDHSYCFAIGRFDSGRGDEEHVCRLRPGHDGDHATDSGPDPITWRR